MRTWFFPLVQRTFNESQVVKFLVCDAELCTGVLIRAAYASSLSGGLSWDALSFGLFLAKPQNCRMPFGGISLCSSVSRCRSVVISHFSTKCHRHWLFICVHQHYYLLSLVHFVVFSNLHQKFSILAGIFPLGYRGTLCFSESFQKMGMQQKQLEI